MVKLGALFSGGRVLSIAGKGDTDVLGVTVDVRLLSEGDGDTKLATEPDGLTMAEPEMVSLE